MYVFLYMGLWHKLSVNRCLSTHVYVCTGYHNKPYSSSYPYPQSFEAPYLRYGHRFLLQRMSELLVPSSAQLLWQFIWGNRGGAVVIISNARYCLFSTCNSKYGAHLLQLYGVIFFTKNRATKEIEHWSLIRTLFLTLGLNLSIV